MALFCYKGPFINRVIKEGGGGVTQMIIFDHGEGEELSKRSQRVIIDHSSEGRGDGS